MSILKVYDGNTWVEFPISTLDASIMGYSPGDLTDWNSSVDPGDVDDALDQLVSRVKTSEGEYVVGPSSVTDLRIGLFDGTTGKLIKQSVVLISPTGKITGSILDPTELTAAGTIPDAAIAESNVTQHVPKVLSVRKTADEFINNDAAFSDDTHLVITPAINTNYILTGMIFVDSNATPDFKYEFGGPSSGASIKVGAGGGRSATSVSVNFNTTTAFNQSKFYPVANTNTHLIWLSGIVTIGSTAGDIAFRWAQQLSNAAQTTVQAGSWMRMEVI